MDEFAVVIMLRDQVTGFLEKELGSYKIDGNEDLIVNIFAEEDGDSYKCHMKISVDKELEDWEFEAVYDYYDNGVFGIEVLAFEEIENCHNPTWEIVFDYDEDINLMELKINKLLKIHGEELESVYAEIDGRKDEYEE